MIGTKIGHYEITAKLGEGGMGEVWRATDAQLGREVALKLLPHGFTEDEERLARFEREAKVLASLNHSNVAQIYGLEASGSTRALVMELVEGPTLDERIAAGPLPLEESLAIARQIAEALEEAHEKGIVHRDLKPQNVKASVDGKVKVLDFGLAKAMDPVTGISGGSASQLAASPTLTLGATVQGVILGTAAYMAPEQAKGLAADKRADIWAFGVVLHEMLTGERMFAAETVPETLAQVLTREPDLGALPESVPPAIRRLLRRCLERQPKRRLRDVGDARLVIDEVLAGKVEEPAGGAAVPAGATPRWIAPAIAAALAAGALAAWWLRPAPNVENRPTRAALAIPSQLAPNVSEHVSIAISPDGRRQALVVLGDAGGTRLLLRDLDRTEPWLLEGSSGAFGPMFSPDGESIAYVDDTNLVRRPFAGGPAFRLTTVSTTDFRGATWSPDGYLYYSPTTASGLFRVSENGGEPQEVTGLLADRQERTHRWPSALPDGSAVLFASDTTASTEYYDDARIEAVRPATGERVTVLDNASVARVLGDDLLVFAREGTLYAIRFDPRSLAVSGPAVPIVQSVATDVSTGAVHFALARNGAAVWLPGQAASSRRRLEWLEPDGATTKLPIPPEPLLGIALSPDESKLAMTIAGTGTSDLWVLDLERFTRSRLTSEGNVLDFRWSPDGKSLAFTSSGNAPNDIYLKSVDGGSDARLLIGGPEEEFPCDFTPDGRGLLYETRRTVGTSAQSDLLRLPLDGGDPVPLLDDPWDETLAALSPDGRYIAYSALEDPTRPEIFVRRFPDLGGKWQVSTDGGTEPRWSPEGDAIFFRGDGRFYRVAVDTSSGFTSAVPAQLGDQMFRGSQGNSYDVARGGRVLRLLPENMAPDLTQVDYASDLAAEARRLTAPKR